MNQITPAEFGKVVKKMVKEGGIKKQVNYSGRISGWGNSTDGIAYDYPRFDWTYQRNNRYVRDYSKCEFEEMEVSYCSGTFGYGAEEKAKKSDRFPEIFRSFVPSDVYEERDGRFFVRVSNKFYKSSGDV